MNNVMKPKKILILGGYGGVGREIARLLLENTNAHITVAGRRYEPAEALVRQLKNTFPKRDIRAQETDVKNAMSLGSALEGMDLVVVATTTPEHIQAIARAALAKNVDYIDIMFDPDTPKRLKPLAKEIVRKKRTFITQAGFHPGLPAVFVRHAAQYLDRYETATVAMAMNARFESPQSTIDIVNAARENAFDIYRNGAWRQATYADMVRVDFGPPFGTRTCFPLHMEELRGVPEKYGIRKCGTYVTGFNWLVDNILFPLIYVAHRIRKNTGTGIFSFLLYHGIRLFSPADLRVVFLIDARGEKNGKTHAIRIRAEHKNGFFFTAAPVAACIMQYLDGTIKPGFHFMGHAVDTKRLFADIQGMGIDITTRTIK